jgi:hypothetical protein
LVYRYNFPSIDTYTDFVGVNSFTNIVNNTFAFTQEADVISYTEITGDVVVAGDLTAENLIVGSTNVITELTSLDTRFDTEEPKTSALKILTSSHSTQISLNDTKINVLQGTLDTEELKITDLQGRLNIEEPKTSALQVLTSSHTTQISSNVNDITALQGRLNIEEPKTTALQILTSSNTTDIDLNTTNILTKQATISSSTDIDTKSLTTTQLEVNGGVNIITKPHFDTIVFIRPATTPQINLSEIQCWVGGVNILPPNSNNLIGYFANWDTDKSFPSGDLGSRNDTVQVLKAYNNSLEFDFGAQSASGNAIIITNIPLTAVEDIQALTLYNRQNGTKSQEARILTMFLNSTTQPMTLLILRH